MYGAGELTELLGLYTSTSAQDSAGQVVYTWTLQVRIYAKRVPMKASERFAGAQAQADVWDRFVVRTGPMLDTGNRLLWVSGTGSPAFDVVAVTPLPDRQYVEVICRQLPGGLQS